MPDLFFQSARDILRKYDWWWLGKALDLPSAVWDTDTQVKPRLSILQNKLEKCWISHGRTGCFHADTAPLLRKTICALHFHTLAAQSGWDDHALKVVFWEGLNPNLKAELACQDETVTFSEYINMAVKVNKLIRLFQTYSPPSMSFNHPVSERMQIGYTRVSPEDHHRRQCEGLCFYCGQ